MSLSATIAEPQRAFVILNRDSLTDMSGATTASLLPVRIMSPILKVTALPMAPPGWSLP